MRIYGIILPLILLLTSYGEIYASHVSGAEITYKHLYGSTYQFNLKVYRDCRECKFNNSGGGDNTNNCNDVPDLIIKGALGTSYSSNVLGTVETNRRLIRDLTPACSSSISKCKPGSNIAVGFEEHIFEGIYDFSSLLNSGYCKFDVSISMFSRSVNINTMMSEQTFFNYTMLNLCENQSNQSVEFTSSPSFLHNINQSNFNALNIKNPDGDSLAFSLKSALVNRGMAITYAIGRSSDAPYNYFCSTGSSCAPNPNANLAEGFYCSPKTGDIAFTPIMGNQGGVVVIECEEWKKNSSGSYYLAGVVRRDVYGDVVSSNNNLPKIKNTTLDYTLCEGNSWSVEVNIEDIPLVGPQYDTVHAIAISDMPGVYLDKIPTSYAPYFRYVLRVEPRSNQVGKHTITILARDNHCPINGKSAKTFTINVLKSRTIQIAAMVKNCGNLEAGSVNFAARNIYWTIRDIQQNVIKQVLNRKISTQLTTGGHYIIEAYMPAESGYCEVKQIDTFFVEEFKKPELEFGPIQKVCKGTILQIQPQVFRTYDQHEILANDKIILSFPYQIQADKAQDILFRIEQNNGCLVEKTLKIELFPELSYTLKNDTICVNDVFPSTIENVVFDKSKVTSITYTFNSGYSNVRRFNDHVWNIELLDFVAHKTELYSTILDKNTCIYKDTTHISIIAPEEIKVTCPDKICINANPISLQTNAKGKWECVNHPNMVTNNKLIPDGRTKADLLLKYTETLKCTNTKNFTVQVMDTSAIAFSHPIENNLCENYGLFNLIATPLGGTWNGEFVEASTFNTNPAAGKSSKAVYTYLNNNGCKSLSSVSFTISKLPTLKVVADKSRVCVGDVLALQALSTLQAPGYWYTDGEGSFEEAVSANTTYKPSAADINKVGLKFIYTIQTNGVCGNVSAETFVQVKVGPNGKILNTYPDSICEPANITFRSNFQRLEKQYWFINDSLSEEFDYNFDFKVLLKAGNYVIKTKVYDSTCEALAFSENITVLPLPQMGFVSNPSVRISREYPRLYLKDNSYSKGGHSTNWYFNSSWIGESREFYYTADDSKDSFYIKLVVSSNIGSCKDSVNRFFVFIPINQLYIPDAFSPDAKGPDENNRFRVQGPEMRIFEIEIFNKYGEKVYVSNKMGDSWDGTYKMEDCSQGVYFYKIITTDYDGISRDYSGTVTLIR